MKKLVIFIFLAVVFLLYSNFLIMYGVIKERKSKICIDPPTQQKLTTIIETTKAVCVDMVKVCEEEVGKELEKQKQSAAYWQKKFNSIPTTTPI